jgi:ubiquinone/menaquinone biosynthesis C-methylase UbiE
MKTNISFSTFFSDVQETPWYKEFLAPVVSVVSPHSKVLDIGTGTGKLLQLLVNEKSADCTGIDVSASMLAEAEKKLSGLPVKLTQVKQREALPFQNKNFDLICICNVLFNLAYNEQISLMNQSLEILKEKGRIIILSPTGKGTFKDFYQKVTRKNNTSFALWYTLTRRSARKWNRQHMLKEYADRNKLSYINRMVFDGFGRMEIIEK